jgi:hypothetical protein
MELYKIISRGKHKHYYESTKTFLRGRKHHVDYLEYVKTFIPNMSVHCYKIGLDHNKQIAWIKIYRYVIQNGKVVAI